MNPPTSRTRFVDRIPAQRAPAAPPALLALAVLLYAVYFSYLTILRYHAFESRALDMGNLHQAIWNTAHGNWFRMTNQEAGLTSRLSMHVEPILLPLAGIYRLFPGVETLLIVQAVVVALGAVPVYLLARQQRLGAWLALLFGVVYLLNPSIQAANWLEFHPVTLVPTLLLAAFYCLVARRTWWFVVFAVLAVACKEEIGLLVGMMGLYVWLALKRPWLGLATLVLGVGWSLLAVLGIQAYFAGGNIHWGRYGYLGETTTAKFTTLITRPGVVVGQLQQANAARYFFELLLPVGFLSLLAPEVLLLALPSLAINLLADFAPMHEVTTLIYAAPIVPFVVASAVMGAARLLRWATARQWRIGADTLAAAVAAWVMAAALLAQGAYGYLPGSGNARQLAVSEHDRRAQAILDQIPPLASVAAQDRLNPHVAGRPTVTIFPRVDGADYVLIDAAGPAWPQHPNDLKRSVDELLAGGYGVAAASDGYLLLSKTATSRTLPPSFYTAWSDPNSLNRQPLVSTQDPTSRPILFGQDLQLLGYDVRKDANGELVADMQWQAARPITSNYKFYVGFLDSEGKTLHDNAYYQPVSVLWYPTSLWEPGKPVTVRSLPWTLPEDRFTLVAGVYQGDGEWSGAEHLPVQGEAGVPVIDGSLVRLGGYQRTVNGDWKPLPPVPADVAKLPAATLDASFGDALKLVKAAVPATVKPGETLPVHLTWSRQGATPEHSRFVHLLDANGAKVAQMDGPVHDALGPLPMAGWPAGQPVDDVVSLALPPNLPAGEYTLIAGLYDWQSGARLNAAGANATPDGAVKLGGVRVQR